VKQTKRTQRVAEVVQREVGHMLLTEGAEDQFARIVLTDCQVSTDLRIARLYYTLLDADLTDKDLAVLRANAQGALESARGHFRHLLGRALRTKYTPELFFHYDETLEHARRIEAVLHDLGPLASAPEAEPGSDPEPDPEEPA
jgi:ribosome-binding factor A